MLKSTISNNSPGHSHNEHTFEVGLSSDICPGNISKRKNKMTIDNNLTIKQCEYILDNLHLIKTLNKSQLKQLNNYAFGEEFMESKDKGTIKEYNGVKSRC